MSSEPDRASTQIGENIPNRGVHPHVYLGGPGFSPRLTKRQRERIIDRCLEVDGPYCRTTVCLRESRYLNLATLSRLDSKYHVFTVDHIDQRADMDHWNWFDNLQIAHPECNMFDRMRWAREQGSKLMSPTASLRRSEREKTATTEIHSQTMPSVIAKAENVPLVITLNYDHETTFRRAYMRMVKEASEARKPTTKKECRPAVREVSGASLASSYSYQERLFSTEGPFEEDIDEFDKSKFVKYRHSEDKRLSIDELMQKYPKTGRSNA